METTTKQEKDTKEVSTKEVKEVTTKTEEIKAELLKIDKTIIIKAKAQSEKDISLSYPLTEYDKLEKYPKGSKRVNINLVNDSVSITYLRRHIEVFISKKLGLSAIQWVEINEFVADKELYQSFNLWINTSVKAYKDLLFKE